jgi:hypothetical protein
VHIAGARELAAQVLLQGQDDLFVPLLGKTPARAVVGNRAVGIIWLHGEQGDFLAQACTAHVIIGRALGIAEIHFVDDRQHRDFEQDGVQPGADDRNLDLAVALGRRVDGDVLLVQVEQVEEIDEVALDKPQTAQIIELVLAKAQLAQGLDFSAYLVHVGHKVDARRAAAKTVFHLRRRKVVQHHLHHRELVEIGV